MAQNTDPGQENTATESLALSPESKVVRGQRKSRQGVVVSDRMEKTIVVRVERNIRHALYGKRMRRSKKYHAHDEANRGRIGDVVRITECRPMSHLKRWRLVEVLSGANNETKGAQAMDALAPAGQGSSSLSAGLEAK